MTRKLMLNMHASRVPSQDGFMEQNVVEESFITLLLIYDLFLNDEAFSCHLIVKSEPLLSSLSKETVKMAICWRIVKKVRLSHTYVHECDTGTFPHILFYSYSMVFCLIMVRLKEEKCFNLLFCITLWQR